MRTALIAPIPELESAEQSDVQMALAHVAAVSAYYPAYYRERSDAGDWVILDNGAHERHIVDMATLFNLAERIHADEVCLPDVPLNTAGTLATTEQAVQWLRVNSEVYRAAGSPTLMLIPQGTTLDDWATCAHRMLEMVERLDLPRRPTIGIAKNHDHIIEHGGHYMILEWLFDSDLSYGAVHLLGWPRDWMTLQDVERDFPGCIRSVDSAKPYIYAAQGIWIDPMSLDQLPSLSRPEHYFTTPIEWKGHMRANIEVFREFAEARA